MGLKHVITERHLEAMAKVMLTTGLIVAYGYLMEHFIAWYSGNEYEQHVFFQTAAARPLRLGLLPADVLQRGGAADLLDRSGRAANIWALWIGSVLINVGMWFERFNIIVTSLHQDFMPSNWAMYYPTWVDLSLLGGTICFFGTLFLLFLKFVPAVAVTELKELNHEMHEGEAGVSLHTPDKPLHAGELEAT